ncbi:transmembrane protein 100 [Nothobranchius furzeri]|uniref:transmembrane protein 100 n=1 Tax=Nothobranchius furzeri TaxID=105023 RepID=UPI002403BBDE|nr:transmembrane protein 100-like [Nothobranchius furzeri]
MTATMETLDPSALTDVPSTVSFQCTPETVTLPKGVVSVVGITVVTGGVELSCRSCMMAFAFWGALIGFSCVAVGLWDQLSQLQAGVSHLLGLGFVILAFSFVMVASTALFHVLTKKKRMIIREERQDGKQVLVEGEEVIKKVTV